MVFNPDLAAHMRAKVSKICPTPDRATMHMRAPSPGVFPSIIPWRNMALKEKNMPKL